MRILPVCCVCCLLAVPALADVRDTDVSVGPYTVHVDRVEQLNKNVRFRGSVSGGGECDTLDFEAFLRNAEGDGNARVAENLGRYEPDSSADIDATTQHSSKDNRHGWYIDNIVLNCVVGGVAARHESNPR